VTVVRQYQMLAKPGQAAALAAVLGRAAALFGAEPGFREAELLQDIEEPEQFVFTHRWDSIERHQAATSHLPADFLADFGSALERIVQGRYLSAVAI